jgi:hypothetical protein
MSYEPLIRALKVFPIIEFQIGEEGPALTQGIVR